MDPERWLAEAVERIRAALDPLLIVQFGSRARGTATRRSDLDLLIVAETQQPPLERIGRVLALLADSPWPVDAIVFTPGEMEFVRHRPFVRAILRDGKVLHERRAA
jgi:predicted nucleotidyltransferase